MNITIPNSVLDNIFTSLQPYLDKKDSSQITSHIYLETKDNQLICKATDFEIGLCAIRDSLTINEHGIATVNGKQVQLDVAPFTKNDRTMVPIRFVAEALGANVDYIPKEQIVEIVL